MNGLQQKLASALELHRLGRLTDAQQIYREILSRDARHADSLHLLGMAAYQSGDGGSAEDLIRRAIAINQWEALYHSNLGIVLQARGNLRDSAACYRMAVALKPDYVEAHSNLAITLGALGRNDEAVAEYQYVLELNPNHAQAHINLGVGLFERGQISDAIAHYRQALALKPECAEALSNLGNALEALDQLAEAEDCYRRAMTLDPDCATACGNLGGVLRAQNRFWEAMGCYDLFLAMRPGSRDALQSKALLQLTQGDFAAGWEGYENRWQRERPEAPRWNGEDLAGGRVLLWGEQGVGDEIMFAGLIPDALRTGNRCLVECEARLQPLFARSFPEAEVVAAGHQREFSVQLPTGSLPRLFRNSEAAFEATTPAYLKADAARRNQFRGRHAKGRRLVGLAWHTTSKKSGRRRSISLRQLHPLFAAPDIDWISLQYGDHDALERQTAETPVFVDRTVDQFVDIDGFAAQVAAMDLVISIDNSAAHLAGALGVPVFLLLPFARDWRWRVDGEDCLWYPDMRLFRQPRPGDWASVIQSVREAL